MNFNRFYLLCVSATLLALSLVSCTGLAEVSAVPYYLAINNLYDDGQFDNYTGQTPTGWENIYSQNLIENGDFNDGLNHWSGDIALDGGNRGRLGIGDGTLKWALNQTTHSWSNEDLFYVNIDIIENSFQPILRYRMNGLSGSNISSIESRYYTPNMTTMSDIQTANRDGINMRFHLWIQSEITHGYLVFDNVVNYNLTDFFTTTSYGSITKLDNGLNDTNTHLEAGNVTWWDDNQALEFYDESWERYNFDLSNEINEGDIIYISYDVKGRVDAEKTCISSDCFWPSTTEEHRGFTEVADANYQLSISNFNGSGFDTTWVAFDNIMIFNLTDIFNGDEPTAEEFETDYLSKMPEWFETYNFLIADVLVANEGDLVVGTVAKDDFLTEFSYMYLAYKQPYSTINILATEDDIIDDCVAEFLFQGDWFDLDANIDTCALNFNNANYDTLLSLLQDGVVKSDLTNDSYFSIKYYNEDYNFRTTQILISFNEVVQSVRTVVIAFGDTTDINDFNKVAFQFRYNDFIVGYQEDAISYLWQDNVIVLTIYNSLLKYNSLNIFIQQTSASPNTELALTELAFLKDTLVSTPTGTRNIDAESDFLLDFQFQYESCGTWDFGCKIKNSMIWLTVESPPAVTMWDKYGELSNQIYDITRIQNDFIDVLDQTGIQAGIGAVLTLFTALFSIMIYSLLSKFFR